MILNTNNIGGHSMKVLVQGFPMNQLLELLHRQRLAMLVILFVKVLLLLWNIIL
jgi:hypothetical protein